jgi:lysyl-tRNA synthetase class II
MDNLVRERLGWHFEDERTLEASGSPLWQVLAVDAPAILANTPEAPDAPVYCEKMMFPAGTAVGLRRRIEGRGRAEQLVDVYETLIEPTLVDPCFVTHVPSVVIPLAKPNKDNPFFADVYELAINGVEISPGYTELNDPDVQAKHFSHQVGDKEEQHKVDDDFLNALKYGMPPAGGMGLGVDRLLMMLTGAESIRDVILFPLMRPLE